MNPDTAEDEDLGDDNSGVEDEDNNSLDSQDNNTTVTNNSIMLGSQIADLTREQLQEKAKLRVRQQLDMQKKKDRQRGAFRKHNSNKTFIKGKRVFNDFGLA